MAEKPITTDPDEQELLKSMNIPLTDPNAKADVDETVTPPAAEKPDDKEETPAAADADGGGDATGDAGGTGGKGADEPVPAPADAAPAAGDVEPADGGGDGAPKPAPAAVTPPATSEPILSDAAKRMAEVEELILAETFDPFSVEGRKLQIEHNRLAAKVEAEPLVAEKNWNAAFAPYVKQFPAVEQKDMEQLWRDQQKAMSARGYSGDALNAAATVAFEVQLAQVANGKKGAEVAKEKTKGAVVAPPVAKTPITHKGAIVAPPAAVSTPAAPKRELTDEEELVATQRKLNPQGMRAALRG